MATSIALAVLIVVCCILFVLLLLVYCCWRQSECDCEHWLQAHKTVTKGKEYVQAELERTKQMVELERGRSRLLEDKLERIHSVFHPPIVTENSENNDD